jgi:hypothetical protein
MADETPRDDWGFTDADHEELEALWKEDDAYTRQTLIDIATTGGVAVDTDDEWMEGTRIASGDGTARMFPPGGMWRELLERLREHHRGKVKGGA